MANGKLTLDELLHWAFLHNDANMIHFLFRKSSCHSRDTQALAPYASGVHAATVILVWAKDLNTQKHLQGFAVYGLLPVLDSVGHGSCHQALPAKIQHH